MTLLGILSWLAFPKMTAMDEIKLDTAGRRLAGDLRYAQSLAISKRVIHGILSDAALAKYTVFAPTTATPITDPADRARTMVVDYPQKPEWQDLLRRSRSLPSALSTRPPRAGRAMP